MKKIITLTILILSALLLLAACNGTTTTAKTPETTGKTNVPETAEASETSKTPETAESTATALPTGPAYKKITAEEGKKLLDGGSVLILVDVRRADEYAASHIPSAINIPNESIDNTQPNALPDLGKTVVVYCRTGVRSKEAADKLVEIGYTDVRDMGGIVDWPYDTVTGTEPGEYVKTDIETDAPSTGIMGNFSTKDIDGNSIDQSIFKKYELTMVNVWATYCSPCLSEMPDLGELAAEHEGKGVRIVGMVSDALNADWSVNNSQIETVRVIISRTGADYLHILPSKDLSDMLSGITAVPTTIFVDRNGNQVGEPYIGSRSKESWNNIISQMLEEVRK